MSVWVNCILSLRRVTTTKRSAFQCLSLCRSSFRELLCFGCIVCLPGCPHNQQHCHEYFSRVLLSLHEKPHPRQGNTRCCRKRRTRIVYLIDISQSIGLPFHGCVFSILPFSINIAAKAKSCCCHTIKCIIDVLCVCSPVLSMETQLAAYKIETSAVLIFNLANVNITSVHRVRPSRATTSMIMNRFVSFPNYTIFALNHLRLRHERIARVCVSTPSVWLSGDRFGVLEENCAIAELTCCNSLPDDQRFGSF